VDKKVGVGGKAAECERIGEVPAFISVRWSILSLRKFGEKVKQDYKQLKAALMKSFSFNQFRAYEEFTMRKHLPYESVDVYLSELKKLASLVDGAENNEEWIKCAFVNGLREETKRQLVAVCELQKMSLEDVAGRARMLVSSERSFNAAVAIKKEVDDRKPRSLLCYTCNKEGHISRYCGARKESPVKCYRCGELGHLASVCSQNVPKNE
jgi:hypothetical protein